MALGDEWDISRALIPSGTDTPSDESSEDEHVPKRRRTLSTEPLKSRARQGKVNGKGIREWADAEGFDLDNVGGDDESYCCSASSFEP